jgi:predicted GIY-YIG superfamily endonuclease/DNA-binding XRE family transcriptional regulator
MTQRTALYRHYQADGSLAYVGVTSDPQRRLAQHVSKAEWVKTIATTEMQWFPSKELALAAESDAIRAEKPIFNKVYSEKLDMPFVAIGIRIRDLRLSLGLNQLDYCKLLGFNATQLSNWETGFRQPTIDNSIIICDHHGVSLDWVYRGRAPAQKAAQ